MNRNYEGHLLSCLYPTSFSSHVDLRKSPNIQSQKKVKILGQFTGIIYVILSSDYFDKLFFCKIKTNFFFGVVQSTDLNAVPACIRMKSCHYIKGTLTPISIFIQVSAICKEKQGKGVFHFCYSTQVHTVPLFCHSSHLLQGGIPEV